MFLWFVILAVAVLCYFGFFWKINYIKNLDYKKFTANVQRRIRKAGDIPPVYPNGWFALLESQDLKIGQVKHVAALGENFAVFRSNDGVVYILDAYCPHLGANLAEGGIVKDNCLQCPFHDWTFSGDGQCQSIPYADNVPSSIKTRAWKCCEVNEIIFVWYHAESLEPDWHIQPVPEILSGNWWRHGRNEFYVNCHIQEIPENGADWAHLSAVHGPAMLFNSISPTIARHLWTNATWRRGPLQRMVAMKNEPVTVEKMNEVIDDELTNEKHKATIHLSHSFILLNKYSIMHLNITAEQIGPGYVELFLDTALGTMCILQTVTPVEPLLQRVTHIIFSPLLSGPYARIILYSECIMFQRDVAVWNHKKFQKNPVLVREDRTILAYRRWYSQYYSPHSPTYQSINALHW